MSRKSSRARPTKTAEARAAFDLIERIVDTCPRRIATSDSERRAHQIVAEEFARLGLSSTRQTFQFNDSLYKNLALHFGIGTLGTAVGGLLPPVGALLHALAASSYWADSTRRGYFLRRLLGFKDSQNILATLPAKGPPKLRIVFLAHVDAAFTGIMFHPKLIDLFATNPPPGLRFTARSLALATRTEATLAMTGLIRTFMGPFGLLLRPAELVLGLPSLIAFLLALDAVLRDEAVPGAADNLSGVAGMLLLAARLMDKKPDNVELVFVATGAEEASLGGADALAVEKEHLWPTDQTVILAFDTFSNGALRFVDREGEVVRTSPPAWLTQVLRETAASEPRFSEVAGMEIPVGGTDAAPFSYRGYPATCLTCIDPSRKAPDHYHQPTDSPENVDPHKIVFCVDFAEKLVERLVEHFDRGPRPLA